MKLTGAGIEKFIARPDPGVIAVLVYGPDSGLVRERAQKLIKNHTGKSDDPFSILEFQASTLRDDPARLSDEASAMSLTGDKRAVFVRDAADALAAMILPVLEIEPADTLIILEAGNLGPRSKLRGAFEKSDRGAAVPCYLDDDRSLGGVIRDTLGARGVTVSRDALAYLVAHLGSDRQVTRSELEKLALFKGDSGEVSYEDAMACIGDSAEATLDDLANAAGSGDAEAAGRLLDRAIMEGSNEVGILRALVRHFTRLHLAGGLVADGANEDAAMKALRPPVFFKQAPVFKTQLRRWSPDRLANALSVLAEAESGVKSSGTPAEALCRQSVLRLCALGGARPGR